MITYDKGTNRLVAPETWCEGANMYIDGYDLMLMLNHIADEIGLLRFHNIRDENMRGMEVV